MDQPWLSHHNSLLVNDVVEFSFFFKDVVLFVFFILFFLHVFIVVSINAALLFLVQIILCVELL
jgi:hypothetical protein